MTKTSILAIGAIAALGATCLGASAFDRDGRDPAARAGSRPAAGGGQATSIEVGSTSVGVAGGKGTAVGIGGNGVSVGSGKGSGVVVGGDGTSVVVGGNGVSVGGRGTGVAVGGDGTSVVVGGNGVSIGGGNGASVVVGGNGTAVGIGGTGVVVAPGSGSRVVIQIPGFKAMALGWNSSGAWVVRTSPTIEGASADALQICNSQFGGCTLSDARVESAAFGCLVVAQSDDADRVFASTGNSPDAARAAVSAQVAGAGLHGYIAYAACNY